MVEVCYNGSNLSTGYEEQNAALADTKQQLVYKRFVHGGRGAPGYISYKKHQLGVRGHVFGVQGATLVLSRTTATTMS